MSIKKGTKLISDAQRKELCLIGDNIRAVRELRGWTLEDMEERGIKNWTHLQEIEKGKKNITIATFLNICRSLETTPNRLLKGIEF